MKPIDAVKKENEQKLISKIYSKKYLASSKAKYSVGDYVRISKFKNKFERGFTRNWSTEIFQIATVFKTDPPTYHLKDERNEIIKGRFYEQELMKTKHPHVYLIEKVLRRTKNKALVKWLGLSSNDNSWIDLKAII